MWLIQLANIAAAPETASTRTPIALVIQAVLTNAMEIASGALLMPLVWILMHTAQLYVVIKPTVQCANHYQCASGAITQVNAKINLNNAKTLVMQLDQTIHYVLVCTIVVGVLQHNHASLTPTLLVHRNQVHAITTTAFSVIPMQTVLGVTQQTRVFQSTLHVLLHSHALL